jgi:uncharacterized OB-fold protein
MDAPGRPLPLPDDDSALYWAAAARGELAMQRCAACRAFRFPPRAGCARCGSDRSEWVPVSGQGTVASFVVVHPPVLPAFAECVPFAIVLVELAEDPQLRVVGNLSDVAPADVRIGMPVAVAFEPLEEDVVLPQWRPATGAARSVPSSGAPRSAAATRS